MTSEQNRHKVIERIRLLLNLGRSPNLNEAESAVAMAKKLMEDFQISQSDIHISATDIQKVCIGMVRWSAEHNFVFAILQQFFNIRYTYITINGRRKVTVYGMQDDIDLALQVAHSLLKTFRSLWAKQSKTIEHQWRREIGDPMDKYSFMSGILFSVSQRLKEQRNNRPVSEKTALVVSETERQKALNAFYDALDTRETKHRKHTIDNDSFENGIIAGLTVECFTLCKGDGKFLPSM